MTYTFHAQKRMYQRQIDTEQVLESLKLGDKEIQEDAIIYTHNNIIVITDIEQTRIITTYHERKLERFIKKLAKKYKVNFAQAVLMYKQQLA